MPANPYQPPKEAGRPSTAAPILAAANTKIMANLDIIARMERLLDAYERREMSSEQLEDAIHFHMEALEALPYKRINEADQLSRRLVIAHLIDGDEEFFGDEPVSAVLRDFREFLKALSREVC